MAMIFDERLSDSPFVERIWRTDAGSAGDFTSIALSRWQMCVWKHQGKTYLTVRGPETKATPAYCPEDAEYFGIVFKFGTFMPHLPAGKLVDNAATLPETARHSFQLHGRAWQFPTYENVDTFIDWLARNDLLGRDPVVEAALQGNMPDLSLRSVQRRFLQATGLSHAAFHQIERARYATTLLKQGKSILDTVEEAGYADQPHLTRALKHYIGQTPAQLLPQNNPQPISFLSDSNSQY